KLRLNSADGWIGSGLSGIGISRLIAVAVWIVVIVVVGGTRGVVVIIGIIARVVIRVIAAGVVRIVIPWIKSPPETVEKNKNAIVMKMCMVSIPVSMPVSVVPRKRMVSYERLTVCCCRSAWIRNPVPFHK